MNYRKRELLKEELDEIAQQFPYNHTKSFLRLVDIVKKLVEAEKSE